MTSLSSSVTPSKRAFHGRHVLIACAACAAALLLDYRAYLHVVDGSVYEQDWGRLLRVVGFWPTWAVAAVALALNDPTAVPGARRRALLVGAAPGIAGLIAEALKLVLRRERPDADNGHYVFRAFADHPFSSAGIGSPSSHAAVAFGGATILSFIFPRTRWVWFALAAGCGLTRVLARAHFASDVVVGALVGVATATWLQRRTWVDIASG